MIVTSLATLLKCKVCNSLEIFITDYSRRTIIYCRQRSLVVHKEGIECCGQHLISDTPVTASFRYNLAYVGFPLIVLNLFFSFNNERKFILSTVDPKLKCKTNWYDLIFAIVQSFCKLSLKFLPIFNGMTLEPAKILSNIKDPTKSPTDCDFFYMFLVSCQRIW